MPLYDFYRLSTGEQWEALLSISARDELLKDPDIQQVPCTPKIVSGVLGITHKLDDTFKEKIARVAEAHPSSPLYDQVIQKGVKEVKTREAFKKHTT